MKENIRKFNKFANYLADEARKISLYYFKRKIKIVSKQDKCFDPVTIADINIQQKLHTLIEKQYPSHSMIGEEESIIKDSEYEWCIDPIDGTKSFIQGVPLWGTLISLSKNNKIILGIADIPALNERYVGYENIAYKIINKKRTLLGVRKKVDLMNAILNSTSPYVFASKSDQRKFEKVAKIAKSTRLGGDCYSYCLLADGHVDLVIESGLKPYDIRALVPIIKNSGGVIKSWEGDSVINGGRILAATSKKLFMETQKILIKK
jgi:myo-inositol-1(or 4)-monophosphatase